MANEPTLDEKQLTDTAAAAAKVQATVEAAFTSMGQAMLTMAQQQKEHAETINQLIADRNQQLELVGRLLKQIETITKLQDSDHAAVEVLTAMQLPRKGMDVN